MLGNFLTEIILKKKLLKFNGILPKINLQQDNFTNLKEIFKSRQLYINDADLTKEYIRFIKPVNENEERKFKKKEKKNISNLMIIFSRKGKINIILKNLGKYVTKKNWSIPI